MSVPGCPISVSVGGGLSGPQVSLPGPGPIHKPSSLLINHSGGRLEDVEVNVEGIVSKSTLCNNIFQIKFRVPLTNRIHSIRKSVPNSYLCMI